MRRLAFAILALGALALPPASASAALEVEPGSAAIELLNAHGEPELRAGAHPDRMITRFAFAPGPEGKSDENLKDLGFDLPPGFVGNPLAVPQCPRGDFLEEKCPKSSQVGVAHLRLPLFGELGAPLYSLEPAGEELAEVAFTAFVVQGRFRITLREGDGGMRLQAVDFSQELPLEASEIELWGVPADHQEKPEEGATEPVASREAFLTDPTNCGSAAPAFLRFRTWQRPGVLRSTPLPMAAFGGCEALPFAPSLALSPGEFDADTPTPLRVELTMAQYDDPDGVAGAEPRSVSVVLPRGFSLSPAVAGGLAACTEAQLGAGSEAPAACPAASRIGSVELRSPALSGALEGHVYIGATPPGAPFRVFVVAERPGFRVKLPVEMRADAGGNLVAQLSELPQLPVSSLVLAFDGGPRAPLAAPTSCGTETASATLVPYGGQTATITAQVRTAHGPGGAQCGHGRPFSPTLSAGSSSPVAGRAGAFSVALRRNPGEGALAGMKIEMPSGIAADTAGVGRCTEAEVAVAACPAAADVGTVMVEAGPGPQPLAISGDVYLTGPYRGAPFGFAMLIPISVGPFQLGTATIRAALEIDPDTGRVTVATDPLPQVVAGIPLRIRTVSIAIDHPGFMRNPTSCAPGKVEAEVTSAEGGRAHPSTPFQVGGCGHLRFQPHISLALSGSSARLPGLRIGVRSKGGSANLRSLTMRLPAVLGLNRETTALVCARANFEVGACPAASRVGRADAASPLIAAPLRGPVWLVQATTVGAPELWTELRGGGVRIVTRTATGQTAGGRLVTRVFNLPDFPLSSLTTALRSGPKSLFTTTVSACRVRRPLAEVSAAGQSGATMSKVVKVGLGPFACGG